MRTLASINKNMWHKASTGLYVPKRFPLDGLVLWLPLWHPELTGTTIVSKDLNALSCTPTGTTWGYQGRTFNGSTDVIDCGGSDSIDSIVGDFSLECWFYKLSINTDKGLISTGNGKTDATVPYTLWVSNNLVDLRMANGTDQYAGRFTGISASTWYHAVGICSGVTMDVYINGVKGSITGTFTGTRQTGTKVTVGAWDTITRFWDGIIGEARIYNRALSGVEIMKLYQATKWKYV